MDPAEVRALVSRKLNGAKKPADKSRLDIIASDLDFGRQVKDYTEGKGSSLRESVALEVVEKLFPVCPTYSLGKRGRRVPNQCRCCDGYNADCVVYQVHIALTNIRE